MTTPEAGTAVFFVTDHRECDAAWAALEAAAGDAARARTLWAEFHRRMERHFCMEEEVLFPAFEAATGMRGSGPTEVMRHEHQQMRSLLADMERRVLSGDIAGMLDQGDSLFMVIQQHNAKEEGMLYPMAENVLRAQWPALATRLKTYG